MKRGDNGSALVYKFLREVNLCVPVEKRAWNLTTVLEGPQLLKQKFALRDWNP